MRFSITLILVAGAALAAEEGEAPITGTVTVNAGVVKRDVPPTWLGHNMEWVWQGQRLFEGDGSGAKEGFVPLIRNLNPGLMRYPGGSLANTFRFADSIGLPAERKPIANFFTLRGGYRNRMRYRTERPLLGFDDFMRFVERVRAKGAMVTVNCTWWPENPEVSGTAEEAAAWVAYANATKARRNLVVGKDPRGTDWKDGHYWADLRAKNGHPEPYNVQYWEIGNEVYAPDQGAGMSAREYADRVNDFARRMKAVDPRIKVGAVLAFDRAKWNEAVVKGAARGKGLVDFLVIHHYAGGGVATKSLALWNAGSRALPIEIEKPGKYRITLEASGQPCAGVFPQMKVDLDGEVLGTYTVDANKHQGKRKTFTFDRRLAAGKHTLTVAFLNDEYKPPEDRNLFLEALYIRPEGGKPQRLSMTSAGEVMRKLAAQTEHIRPRQIDPVDALQKRYGTSLPYHVTEYGVMYGQSRDELMKSRDQKGALVAGRIAQIALEDPRIEGSNFWCIKSAWFRVIEQGPKGFRLAPSGVALRTLAPLAQGQVIETKWHVPAFDDRLGIAGRVPWVAGVAVKKKGRVALSLLSWHPTRAAEITVQLKGVVPRAADARVLRLVGPGPNAMNQEGQPAVITLREETLQVAVSAPRRNAPADAPRASARLRLPPCSMATILFETKDAAAGRE